MNLLRILIAYFGNKSKPFIVTVNIALLLCVGFIDYVTGFEVGISLFYLIPISFAAWLGSRTQSIIVSFLSVLTIATADFMAGDEFPHFLVDLWNLIMHLGFFVVYAFVLSLVKSDLDKRMRLVEELQKTLSEVKQLKGLLPICASCKNIRDDKGYWTLIESYISSHTEAQFTHGICPECAEKMYPEEYQRLVAQQEEKAADGQ